MPTSSLSPLQAAASTLEGASATLLDDPLQRSSLLEVLKTIPDPRSRRGVRHRCAAVVAGVCAAMFAGCLSFAAIAEWIAAIPAEVIAKLDIDPARRPSEPTLRRLIEALDAEIFEAAINAFVAAKSALHTDAAAGLIGWATDGKTSRGARTAGTVAPHFLSAMNISTRTVIGQVEVGEKTNETTRLVPLLKSIGAKGVLVTADALHAVASLATEIVTDLDAHYLLVVKGNQPRLRHQLSQLPWKDMPIAYREDDTGHGRHERRLFKACQVQAGLGFPHAQQALRIERKRRRLGTRAWSTETVYAITDLDAGAAQPATLAHFARQHWQIENSIHYVRDVTLGEDASRIRTGSGPQVMACLRNLTIATHRLNGHRNIASALRHTAWNAHTAVKHLLTG